MQGYDEWLTAPDQNRIAESEAAWTAFEAWAANHRPDLDWDDQAAVDREHAAWWATVEEQDARAEAEIDAQAEAEANAEAEAALAALAAEPVPWRSTRSLLLSAAEHARITAELQEPPRVVPELLSLAERVKRRRTG